MPFLLFRDEQDVERVLALTPGRSRVTIGRRPTNDLVLSSDPEVSRIHAVLELVGGEWTVVDDGLSRNGSFLNDCRVRGRERLRDRDRLRVGRTELLFRAPDQSGSEPTAIPDDLAPAPQLSAAKRRVLIALCRPLADSSQAAPATNSAIAAELQLSLPTVKAHLRELFALFGVDGAPQYRKRSELALAALATGALTQTDLESEAR